eukprot:TRINITY_DN5842_c0_g4_i2.p1 TRINITY_DN5842_c0_g4~~TRINITY_DN5842_c0_g4_i2.p1  ORF type:complete len:1046 (+),score=221.33 TRINITY_DN5842_c0_g4_i2:70-3207(+)
MMQADVPAQLHRLHHVPGRPLGLTVDAELVLESVQPGSPAEAAGFGRCAGLQLHSVAGVPVSSREELLAALASLGAGELEFCFGAPRYELPYDGWSNEGRQPPLSPAPCDAQYSPAPAAPQQQQSDGGGRWEPRRAPNGRRFWKHSGTGEKRWGERPPADSPAPAPAPPSCWAAAPVGAQQRQQQQWQEAPPYTSPPQQGWAASSASESDPTAAQQLARGFPRPRGPLPQCDPHGSAQTAPAPAEPPRGQLYGAQNAPVPAAPDPDAAVADWRAAALLLAEGDVDGALVRSAAAARVQELHGRGSEPLDVAVAEAWLELLRAEEELHRRERGEAAGRALQLQAAVREAEDRLRAEEAALRAEAAMRAQGPPAAAPPPQQAPAPVPPAPPEPVSDSPPPSPEALPRWSRSFAPPPAPVLAPPRAALQSPSPVWSAAHSAPAVAEINIQLPPDPPRSAAPLREHPSGRSRSRSRGGSPRPRPRRPASASAPAALAPATQLSSALHSAPAAPPLPYPPGCLVQAPCDIRVGGRLLFPRGTLGRVSARQPVALRGRKAPRIAVDWGSEGVAVAVRLWELAPAGTQPQPAAAPPPAPPPAPALRDPLAAPTLPVLAPQPQPQQHRGPTPTRREADPQLGAQHSACASPGSGTPLLPPQRVSDAPSGGRPPRPSAADPPPLPAQPAGTQRRPTPPAARCGGCGGLPPLAPNSPAPGVHQQGRDSPMRRMPPASPCGGSARSSGMQPGYGSPFRALAASLQGSQGGSVWSGASYGARWGTSAAYATGSRSGSAAAGSDPGSTRGAHPQQPLQPQQRGLQGPEQPPPQQWAAPWQQQPRGSGAPAAAGACAQPGMPPRQQHPPAGAVPTFAAPPAGGLAPPPALRGVPAQPLALPTPDCGGGGAAPRPWFTDPVAAAAGAVPSLPQPPPLHRPGAVIENLPPPPVLHADGTLSRPPGAQAAGMGPTLRRNPFHFADVVAEWERRTGRDRHPPPAPAPPIEWGPLPDTSYADIPPAEWHALDEANRLREGLPASTAQSVYWTAFLDEVQRMQQR